MNLVIFIGDEPSAAGFRLAGASVVVADAGGELPAFEAARASSQLVVLTRSVAAALPEELLDAAIAASPPLVAIVPDSTGGGMPDFARSLRARLGLEP